jgi:hypothetical protein
MNIVKSVPMPPGVGTLSFNWPPAQLIRSSFRGQFNNLTDRHRGPKASSDVPLTRPE